MVKQKTAFKIPTIASADANPDSVPAIGASDVFIRNPLTQERMQELEAKHISAHPEDAINIEKEKNESNEVLVDKLIAPNKISILPRNKIYQAPKEWNFFGNPSDQQYMVILKSIEKYGLWHPITVWQQPDGRYMILGGHTREKIFDHLFQLTGDEKWLYIEAKIYAYDAIDEYTAKRIIILSNFAQRAQENTKIRSKCYAEMAKIEKHKVFYGSGIDIGSSVSKMLDVSRSTFFFYTKVNKMIDPFLDMFSENKLSRQEVNKLAALSTDIQEFIYNNFKDVLTNYKIRKLKKSMTKDDITKLFTLEDPIVNKFQYVVSFNKQIPKSCKILPLYVDKKDSEILKNQLLTILDTLDISDKSKKELKKQLEA